MLPTTPKSVRLSMTALSGAVMAVVWIMVEELFATPPAVFVSASTSLVMLVAQFMDFRAKSLGAILFDGDDPGGTD